MTVGSITWTRSGALENNECRRAGTGIVCGQNKAKSVHYVVVAVRCVMFAANTTYSIRIHADAENCIVDGVRATGASISDGSGTSVIGDNDTT